jgi:hypothetical protein
MSRSERKKRSGNSWAAKLVVAFEDDFEEVLLDDDETDLSFLKEDFEDLCLFSGDFYWGGVGGEDMDSVEVDFDVDVTFVNDTEEMLFC